jgi:hypothetical protein
MKVGYSYSMEPLLYESSKELFYGEYLAPNKNVLKFFGNI